MDRAVLFFAVLSCGQELPDLEVGKASNQVRFFAGGEEDGETGL